MRRYSVQRYGFLSSAKNIDKNIGKTISKNVSGKFNPGMLPMRQKRLDNAKQSTADAFKKSNSKNSKSNWWFDW